VLAEFLDFLRDFDFVELSDKYRDPDICRKTDKDSYACEQPMSRPIGTLNRARAGCGRAKAQTKP